MSFGLTNKGGLPSNGNFGERKVSRLLESFSLGKGSAMVNADGEREGFLVAGELKELETINGVWLVILGR